MKTETSTVSKRWSHLRPGVGVDTQRRTIKEVMGLRQRTVKDSPPNFLFFGEKVSPLQNKTPLKRSITLFHKCHPRLGSVGDMGTFGSDSGSTENRYVFYHYTVIGPWNWKEKFRNFSVFISGTWFCLVVLEEFRVGK